MGKLADEVAKQSKREREETSGSRASLLTPPPGNTGRRVEPRYPLAEDDPRNEP